VTDIKREEIALRSLQKKEKIWKRVVRTVPPRKQGGGEQRAEGEGSTINGMENTQKPQKSKTKQKKKKRRAWGDYLRIEKV